ncbi:MAG TPA: FAD-dependent oxidoreductase, partial [Mycobacterium sp.]
MTQLKVAIIGAGIGGLTAALALRARGVDVAVYEKAHEIRELGAGVVIGENGARVYDTLGLRDALAAIAGKINGWSMHTWTGEPLTGWRAPYRPEDTYPLHRAEFQRMLFDALPPGTVRLGHGCTTAVEDADGVRIEFTDG